MVDEGGRCIRFANREHGRFTNRTGAGRIKPPGIFPVIFVLRKAAAKPSGIVIGGPSRRSEPENSRFRRAAAGQPHSFRVRVRCSSASRERRRLASCSRLCARSAAARAGEFASSSVEDGG